MLPESSDNQWDVREVGLAGGLEVFVSRWLCMRTKPIQLILCLLVIPFAILWYAGVWQRGSLLLMIALLSLLSSIQIIDDINSPFCRALPTAVGRSRHFFWFALRIGFTFALVALGCAVAWPILKQNIEMMLR